MDKNSNTPIKDLTSIIASYALTALAASNTTMVVYKFPEPTAYYGVLGTVVFGYGALYLARAVWRKK